MSGSCAHIGEDSPDFFVLPCCIRSVGKCSPPARRPTPHSGPLPHRVEVRRAWRQAVDSVTRRRFADMPHGFTTELGRGSLFRQQRLKVAVLRLFHRLLLVFVNASMFLKIPTASCLHTLTATVYVRTKLCVRDMRLSPIDALFFFVTLPGLPLDKARKAGCTTYPKRHRTPPAASSLTYLAMCGP